jgi:integrase
MTEIQTTTDKTMLTERDARALQELLTSHSSSKSTQRAYKGALAEFNAWLAAHNYQPDEAGISSYLLALDEAGAKTATIRLKLAAIRYVHDAGQSKAVKATMAAIVRRRGAAVQDNEIEGVRGNASKSKSQITLDQLRRMMQREPESLTEARNRALILVGFWLAARRSELVAMNVEDIEWTQGGAYVTIRQSKTDQAAEGTVKPLVMLANGDKSICPTTALKAWLAESGITKGAIFVQTSRGKLSKSRKRITAQVVALVVKAHCERVNLPASAFAGHSLRSGFVTAARQIGIPDAVIKQVTTHKTDKMLDHYDKRGPREALDVIRKAVVEATRRPIADNE